MSEKIESGMPQQREKSIEAEEIERKIGKIVDRIVENNHTFFIEPLEERKYDSAVNESEDYNSYSVEKLLVYTDGKREEQGRVEDPEVDPTRGVVFSQRVNIEGATLIVTCDHTKMWDITDKKVTTEWRTYHIKAKNIGAVRELINSKSLPEIQGAGQFQYDKSATAEQVTDEKLEQLKASLPKEAQTAILNTLERNGLVEIYPLNDSSVRTTEVDKTPGEGKYPHSYKRCVTFADGEMKRGNDKDVDNMRRASNTDGGIRVETRVTIRNASVVVIERYKKDHFQGGKEETILEVYSTAPDKFAEFTAKMAEKHK